MALNGIVSTASQMMSHLETWGGPTTFPHFAIGWAWAGDTPFQWTKQVASHFGGTRNGMVLHWPNRITAKGEIRSQFHHVIDVAPTVLEAAGLPEPNLVNGVPQRPMDGVSMLYTVDDAKAADRRTTQYFEMFGNRAIYHEGWVAATRHSIAAPAPLRPGRHTIVYEFIPDEAKPGTGGKSILGIDGQKVAEGHIPKTQPFAFSGDEGADVGLDGETNVSNDYAQGDNAFTGRIVKVTVEQK
jgi:hypothetical protein